MRLLLALLLLVALPVQAEGFITRLLDKPVPGGVAVVQLGQGAQAPTARYQGKPVLVVKEEGATGSPSSASHWAPPLANSASR